MGPKSLVCADVSGMEGTVVVKIVFLVAEDWYFWSHRLPLARACRKEGFEVVVAARVGEHAARIEKEGFKLLPLVLKRNGMGFVRDSAAIGQLIALYLAEKPDIVHHVALKPVLYGSIAARLTGVRAVVNALPGMGYFFISQKKHIAVLRPVVRRLLRLLLNAPRSMLLLQNEDDKKLVLRQGMAPEEKVAVIRGSGIDVDDFHPSPEPPGPPVVLLPSRMLWDKGVGEFVGAATLHRQSGGKATFVLVGDGDAGNPTSIPPRILNKWHNEGAIEWWGRREDMASVFSRSHIVALPSYREGLPRALLEAMACGRPIVTTDVPGCRDLVKGQANGLLVPVRDPKALAEALALLIMNPTLRKEMGSRAREIAVREFRVERVVSETMDLYHRLLN